MSEEERVRMAEQMTEMAELANKLMPEKSEFKKLVGSMLASRQMYSVCLYELERLTDEYDFSAHLSEGAEQLTDEQKMMFREVLISAAAATAQRPFEEAVLFQGMVETVFPWLREVVVKHAAKQESDRQRLTEEKTQARLATKIDLGIPIFPENIGESTYELDRTSSVLFVGEEAPLKWLTNHILKHLAGGIQQLEQILNLTERESDFTDSKVQSVSKAAWAGCANTINNTNKQNIVRQKLESDVVDVVLVSDVCTAYREMLSAPRTSVANEAQRKLKPWTDKAGALLVSSLPLTRPLRPNELNMPEYELLRTHNILRGVSAVPTDDGYQIMVGTQLVAKIPKQDLESYKVSNVIVP